MSARQGVLLGMESYFREDWHPQPAIDARIRNYLQGFAAHGRQLYAKRKYIASKLRIGVRTLARYFRHYREIGFLETVKRTARTAFRQVTETKVLRPFSGPSIEENRVVQPTPDKKERRSLPECVSAALARAKDRINRAKNPAAYRQSIISTELRLGARPKTEKKWHPPDVKLSPQEQTRVDVAACRRFGSWLTNCSAS